VLVEHAKIASSFLEMMNHLFSWFRTIIWGKREFNLSWLGNNIVLTSVLITKRMSTDNDWMSPAWHESWNVRNNDGFSENGTIEDISDCSIW
jgi:hypothetical protein